MIVKGVRLLALFITVMVMLSACSGPQATGVTPTVPGVTPTPSVAISSGAATPTEPCAFLMASFYGGDPTSPVAPLQAKIKAGLEAAGVQVSDLKVEGFGETCGTQKLCCMSTPVTISLQAADLKDREALGNLLGKALKVIYGAEDYRSATVNVTFNAPGGQEQLSFNDGVAREALDKGLTGATLLDAIASPSQTPSVPVP